MQNKKPEWLEALENQSWQAELIASGLAIYGSIALGPILQNLAEVCAVQFSSEQLDILYFGFVYLFFAQAILVGAFIFHLVLRILWAGFVGLSSAYPNGINIENDSYTRDFLSKIKTQYPSLSEYSLKLDEICSKVFSSLCNIVIIFMTITLWIGIIFLLSLLVKSLFGVEIIKYAVLVFSGVLFVFALIVNVLTTGPWKEKKFAKKKGYPAYRLFSKYFFFIGSDAMNYISWTQRTNTTKRNYVMGIILIMIPATIIMAQSLKNIAPFMIKSKYLMWNEHPYNADARNYEDQFEDHMILKPILQSKHIENNYLELFIPLLQREEQTFSELCGKSPLEKVSRFDIDYEKRLEYYKYREDCAAQLFNISIDNGIEADVNFSYKRHELNKQRGYRTFIDVKSLSIGEHLLHIRYTNKEIGEDIHRVIPFYKS